MNMTFYIKKMILWLKNGDTRILKFKNDKVNVITGNSKTGKTAILEIIDYCLCGSDSNISYEHIGENVLWYGLNFCINEKLYTIARGEYKDETKLSKDYYFSPDGNIPKLPYVTIGESQLKEIIEQEFSINSKVTFGYGGKAIRQNSKISYRYFMLFNTLSGDVINHSKYYFDKMDLSRYREALPRIFDLALGITTIENLMIKEKIDNVSQKISKLERDKKKLEKEIENQNTNLNIIIKKAKELKIISPNLIETNECIKEIKYILETGNLSLVEVEENKEIEILKQKKQLIEIQIKKLRRFKNRYATYKNSLSAEEDSLKPIKYIKSKFSDNITNDEYRQFLNILEIELGKIKKTIKDKMPFEYGVDDKIDGLEDELSIIKEKLKIIPDIDDSVKNDRQRLISIGELKTEFFNIINHQNSADTIDESIRIKGKELDELKAIYNDPEERKLTTLDALNDYVQTYIDVAKTALDEYGTYLATFDYNKMVLKLRRNKSTTTANITSSSDHLFMHLCLFLGMHQLIMNNNIPYVMPFLIMDQPSRPYFNNSTFDYNMSKESLSNKDDWNKVKEIFKLMNTFFENILNDNKHFQIILLEHVSIDAWADCNNIHLVEIFDGINNALIPPINNQSNN
ncbi:DUF3732 domain-containing protein [Erysipelatoclostridium sp. An173]|uniref:DUF3732 domain-containing protein n=1 Tax=Erysipelatoclostridium sp. An173 TaxID=1965571 RepID=UPI0032082E69